MYDGGQGQPTYDQNAAYQRGQDPHFSGSGVGGGSGGGGGSGQADLGDGHGPPTGAVPQAPVSSYMRLSNLFKKKLPPIPNYTVPAWAQEENTKTASWYLMVHRHGENIETIDLSRQSRFLCGRAGESRGETDGIDVDLGTHHSVSRCVYSRTSENVSS